MSLKKNVFRIVVLLVGFVLTLMYYGDPGPRTTEPSPLIKPPLKQVALKQNDSTILEQTQVEQNPIKSEVQLVSELATITTDSEIDEEVEANLLAEEQQIAAQLGSSFSGLSSLNIEQEQLLNELQDDLNQENQAAEVRASLKLVANSKATERSVIFYNNDQSSPIYGSLEVPNTSSPAVTTSMQNVAKNEVVTKSKPQKKIEAETSLKTNAPKGAQENNNLKELMSENISLREKLLTTELLLGEKSVSSTKVEDETTAQKMQQVLKEEAVNRDDDRTSVSVTAGTSKKLITRSDRMALRIGPDKTYSIIDLLDQEEQLQVNYLRGSWANVTTANGVTAWLSTDDINDQLKNRVIASAKNRNCK